MGKQVRPRKSMSRARWNKVIYDEKIRQAKEELATGVTYMNIRAKALKIVKYDNDLMYSDIYNVLFEGIEK